MEPTYRIALTREHYSTAVKRFEQQQSNYSRNKLLPIAPLLLSLAAAAVAALTESRWEGALIVLAFAGALAAGLWWMMQRRFIAGAVRRSPEFGETVLITLSERGARSVARDSATDVSWNTFTHATSFPDGFVLSQGTVNSWLPNAALSGASPVDVTELLQSKLARFHAVRRFKVA